MVVGKHSNHSLFVGGSQSLINQGYIPIDLDYYSNLVRVVVSQSLINQGYIPIL